MRKRFESSTGALHTSRKALRTASGSVPRRVGKGNAQ
ncbi:hypothetical protein [Enterococcus phage PEF7b]